MRGTAWGVGLLLLVGSGCPDDRLPPAPAGSSSSGSGDSSNTTGAGPGDSTGPAGSTGPAWPLPTDDDLLTCVRTCELPSDCCPPNTEGSCPSAGYPYNYLCYDGLCVNPPCLADVDCPGEGEQCLPVGGLPSCVLPCDDDAPCQAVDSDQTCAGMTDEGQSYCFAHCSNPGVFCGNTSCDEASGVCVCSSAGQCQSSWECV